MSYTLGFYHFESQSNKTLRFTFVTKALKNGSTKSCTNNFMLSSHFDKNVIWIQWTSLKLLSLWFKTSLATIWKNEKKKKKKSRISNSVQCRLDYDIYTHVQAVASKKYFSCFRGLIRVVKIYLFWVSNNTAQIEVYESILSL